MTNQGVKQIKRRFKQELQSHRVVKKFKECTIILFFIQSEI